jgi:YYY domain-containing protein
MIFDWIAREGGMILSWWLLVTLAGAAALPLVMRLLGGLPDRGYTLARAAGVLLVAFVYWLLAILGFLRNDTSGMLLAWVIVLVVGAVAFLTGPRIDLRAWWASNKRIVLAGELLFIGLFVAWAIVRAQQNGLYATEKPMELAFISAAMRSEAFPPNDPWMAGYAISYYYFGYVITAMLAMLSGAPSTMAFNLILAMLFALTGLTVFGVVANLVRAAQKAVSRTAPAILTGLLGAVFVILLGNYQVPLIEIPYQTGIASPQYLAAIDADERNELRPAPAASFQEWSYWWFFRGARVLNDRNLDGSRNEVIDEFPQFSFLLADVHPHVLALPFAVLALGLALNIVLTRRSPALPETALYAVASGGLIFMNTWDGPIYMAALVGAEALRRLSVSPTGRWSRQDFISMAIFGGLIVGLAVALYFPFLVSFRSQLGGVLPNVIHPTSFSQFGIMFGPLLLLLAAFLGVEAWRARGLMHWRFGVQAGLTILWVLFMVMFVLLVLGALLPDLRGTIFGFIDQNGGLGTVFPQILSKRLTHIFTSLLLVGFIIVALARMFPRVPTNEPLDEAPPATRITVPTPTAFALLLVCMGAMLTLIPEFVYLRDNFGTRMNTVFKFYYQAWIIWGIAAAYGLHVIFGQHEGERILKLPARVVLAGGAVVAISLGLLYPVLGVYYRTQIENGAFISEPQPMTLDGALSAASAADVQVTLCLGEIVRGDDAVVAARVGGSYDIGSPATGLAGRLVGLPNLINWPGHQGQWRGGTYNQIAGSREFDIDRLFGDPTWRTAEEIIARYGITHIMFGDAERDKYGIDAEIKFRDRLPVVCESGNSRIYLAVTQPDAGIQG